MMFLQTILKEMTKGNFSFAILIFGILQFIVMVDAKRNK
jgi:hypothetical protein